MYKKTTMGLTIATILIAYMSVLALSNEAYAPSSYDLQLINQTPDHQDIAVFQQPPQGVQGAANGGQVLAGHETQIGKLGQSDVPDNLLSLGQQVGKRNPVIAVGFGDAVTQANVKVLGQEAQLGNNHVLAGHNENVGQGIKAQVEKGLEFAWVIKGPGHTGLAHADG